MNYAEITLLEDIISPEEIVSFANNEVYKIKMNEMNKHIGYNIYKVEKRLNSIYSEEFPFSKVEQIIRTALILNGDSVPEKLKGIFKDKNYWFIINKLIEKEVLIGSEIAFVLNPIYA